MWALVASLVGCRCDLPPMAPGVGPPGTEPMPTTEDTGASLAWTLLDNGYRSSCGLLDDQRLVCWGEPEQVAISPAGPFVGMAVDGRAGCGLQPDGRLHCWCFDDDRRVCSNAPRGTYVGVQTGGYWACVEDSERLMTCWGWPIGASDAPTKPVLDWSIEADIGCAVLEDQSVSCWGATELFADSDPPALLAPPDLAYTHVSVGRTHACAIDTAGEAHCCGRTGFLEPFPTPPPGPWSWLASGNQVTCGVRPDGTADCWYDLPGIIPQWTLDPTDQWAQLALGEFDGCGVTQDGRGVCFGVADNEGELTVPSLEDL